LCAAMPIAVDVAMRWKRTWGRGWQSAAVRVLWEFPARQRAFSFEAPR
jgi:hypothetical protein